MPSKTMANQSPSGQSQSEIITCVAQTIDRYNMFSPRDKVLVGVSGGPDSVALLHILMALASRYQLQLAVAHFNHGLRPQASDSDAAFVQKMAIELNLPFYTATADVDIDKGSIEEWARELRYDFFKGLIEEHGHTKLALGHQKNDNAEALLLHLMRGSGIRGLAGIPPVRDHWVVRPLLDVARARIMAFLNQRNLAFVEDASNADVAYERNRVRHQLIPILAENYNPNIVDVLHRTADLCRQEDEWFKGHLRPLLEKAVASLETDQMELHLGVLASHPVAIQRRLIREALTQWHGHLRRMTVAHIDTLIELSARKARGKRISLPYGIEAERGADHLCFYNAPRHRAPSDGKAASFYYWVPDKERLPLTIDIPQAGCRMTFEALGPVQPDESLLGDPHRAWFDMDELSFPLVIRNVKPGDRISPYGMQGSKKVKKVFNDLKIPPYRRWEIPLLESEGALLWIAGVRRSSLARLSSRTCRILSVQMVPAGRPESDNQWPPAEGEPEKHA